MIYIIYIQSANESQLREGVDIVNKFSF